MESEKIDIRGFPNYCIDKNGNVYNKKNNTIKKQHLNIRGYLAVTITREDKKQVSCCIHRLLAENFLENPNNYKFVDHIDSNKLNNDINNLKWAFSVRDNVKMASKIGNLPNDNLKDIVDFPLYQISNNGKVFNKLTGRELVFGAGELGYQILRLRNKDKILKNVSAHRLVALHFIPNPKNKPFVDHIDRNPRNNDISNLRWASYAENMFNCSVKKNSTSGTKGVFKGKNRKKEVWVAEIAKSEEKISKKFPYTEDGLREAIKWRKEKEEELHVFT